MAVFKRGITNPNFNKALNQNPYWQGMLNDQELFIAIRDEYISVYYFGQCLCEIRFVKGAFQWKSHKKYLGLDEEGYTDTGEYLERLEDLKQTQKPLGEGKKSKSKNTFWRTATFAGWMWRSPLVVRMTMGSGASIT